MFEERHLVLAPLVTLENEKTAVLNSEIKDLEEHIETHGARHTESLGKSSNIRNQAAMKKLTQFAKNRENKTSRSMC